VPRAAKPQISFADWELLQQGISLEPLLQSISDFLDDHEETIEAVRHDLERGLKNPATGRGGQASFVISHIASLSQKESSSSRSDSPSCRILAATYRPILASTVS
jgi:hypothetical protein